jgi:hypothetical protein
MTQPWNLGGPKIYGEADIDNAIAAGVLSAETAARLKDHVLGAPPAPPVTLPAALADEERFRLIGGFNDIFVTIACALPLFALGWLLNQSHPSLGWAAVAAAAWGLAEYFVRTKRLALTALVLLACFAAGVFLGVIYLFRYPQLDIGTHLLLASAVTAPAVWLHWRRFHVPATVACGVAAGLGLVPATLITLWPTVPDAPWRLAFFCCGLIALALALRWDSSDILRQTRRSDVAFWLHLLAAPLLVHPLFSHLGGFSGKTSVALAGIMVGIYVILGLLSLIIDRRALLVSALAYVLYAFTVVFKAYGVVYENLAVAALVIGSALLLLAALWQPARARVVTALPHGLQKRLPPVRH